MEAMVFVKMLHQALARSSSSSKRHILRVTRAEDYYKILHVMKKAKKTYRRLAFVRPLPLIHSFSCQGTFPPSFMKNFSDCIAVEADIPITVHALPASGAVSIGSEMRVKRPFVPPNIRKLRVPAVWKRSLGERIKIGVIDTGADYMHPDLQPVLSRGINLLNPRTLPYDDNGHGTHIAGTIAASGRQAMTGIAPKAIILPVKAFDHNGSAYVSDIIKGIDWCVHNQVHIINMSFGMKRRSQAMLDAVRNARKSGVVIVASSGNDGRSDADYPARFKSTISVGALARNGEIASFSNRGSRIDVYAPGEKIISTWPNSRYHEMTGTSMATSHVTGILALALSVKPRLTPLQLKRLVANGQIPLAPRKVAKSKKARKPGRIDAVRIFKQL